MAMKSVSFFAMLLVSMAIAHARTMEPDESLTSPCDKCMLVSRKAESFLNSQILFAEANKLSGEACELLPSILENKCLKKSRTYLHEARLILQDFFDENHLCKGTGLCTKPESTAADLFGMNDLNEEVAEERGCPICQKAVRSLLTNLKSPKMRSKILEVLLDYCEEAEEEDDQCKRTINNYGPTILHKLEKFRATELCSMIGMCQAEDIVMKA